MGSFLHPTTTGCAASMPLEPRIYPEPPRDTLQTAVRGVCGVLLGLVFGLVVWTKFGPFEAHGTIAEFIGCIVACAFGAIRHGDDFWVAVLGRGR